MSVRMHGDFCSATFLNKVYYKYITYNTVLLSAYKNIKPNIKYN